MIDINLIFFVVVYLGILVGIFFMPIEQSNKLSIALIALATLITAYTLFSELREQNLRNARTDVNANEEYFTGVYRTFATHPELTSLYKEMYDTPNTSNHAMMVVMIQQMDNIVQFYGSVGEQPTVYWSNSFRTWVNTPTFDLVWPQVRSYYNQLFADYIYKLKN